MYFFYFENLLIWTLKEHFLSLLSCIAYYIGAWMGVAIALEYWERYSQPVLTFYDTSFLFIVYQLKVDSWVGLVQNSYVFPKGPCFCAFRPMLLDNFEYMTCIFSCLLGYDIIVLYFSCFAPFCHLLAHFLVDVLH